MLVDVFGMPLVTPLVFSNTGMSTQVIDAANDAVGTIFRASKNGNVSQIGLNVAAKTGVAPTFRVAVESVTDTRVPSGTVLGGGTAKSDITDPAVGWVVATLDTPLALTQGTLYAVTIKYLSGTVGASNNITVSVSGQTERAGPPYAVSQNAGTWSQQIRNLASMIPLYDDGTYEFMLGGCRVINQNTWSSSSNPLYIGNRWDPNFRCTVVGVLANIRPADASDFTIEAFEGTNTTAIRSTSVDASQALPSNASHQTGYFQFDSPIDVYPGTPYRFVLKPTTATSINAVFDAEFATSAGRKAAGFGDLYRTTSPSAVAWTDTPTRVVSITPVFGTIDNGEKASVFG